MKLLQRIQQSYRSIYWIIASGYFLLLALSVAASGFVYWLVWQKVIQSESQITYWHSAEALAEELRDYTAEGLDRDSVIRVFKRNLRINPIADPYLLDSKGKILVSLFGRQDDLIQLAPLQQFLNTSKPTKKAIYIANPIVETPTETTFSVAPISIADEQGYVLLTLTGFRKTVMYQRLGDITLIAGSLMNSLLFASVSIAFGLFLFSRITKRFRRLNSAMHEFESGAMHHRAIVESDDEFGVHERAFNQMADAIESAISTLTVADENRRALVANVSNELYQPVLAMSARIHNIEENTEALNNEQIKIQLNEAVQSCKTLNKLLSELFELAKLNAPGYVPQSELIDAADIISDVIQSYRQAAKAKKIEFVAKLPDSPLFTKADSRLFNKVVSSLIDNAVRFSPFAGRVEVELKAKEGKFYLQVIDSGPGITEKALPHLFTRLPRKDIEANTINAHFGFSLAIAKSMAEAHGGTLSITTNKGVGSTFVLELPLSEI